MLHTVFHFGPMLTGTAYYFLEQCLQILQTNLWIPHTLLHFGPMLSGTAYYLMEQRLQVLHKDLWSNLTDAVNTNFFWTTAHRYGILPFRALLPGSAYAFWSKTHTYIILSFGPLLKDTA
jgi:hypothetical protein